MPGSRREVAGVLDRAHRLQQDPQATGGGVGCKGGKRFAEGTLLGGAGDVFQLPADEQVETRRADAPCELGGRDEGALGLLAAARIVEEAALALLRVPGVAVEEA